MSFDALAPHYRWLEVVLAGRVLQRARLAHLAALDRAEHVLLVGEGPGRFLAALRARRPDVAVTVVDHSAAMLRAARRTPHADRTTFVQADLRTWDVPTATYDGIVTACVLDCFRPETVARIVHRLAQAARTSATWLHIDFAIPSDGWQRRRARIIHALMYATFRSVAQIEARAVTLPDHWLLEAGFDRLDCRQFSAGLIRSDLWVRS